MVGFWRAAGATSDVARLRTAVAETAAQHGVDGQLLEDLRLAVTEAVTNAVVHGIRGHSGVELRVALDVTRDGLVLTVRDTGVGMSPNPDSPGAGYGLGILRALASDVAVRTPEGGGTEVVLTFAIGQAAERPTAHPSAAAASPPSTDAAT
jgi:anti-sigma regulatory factor (Ser/Thr protein kinase)